MISIITAVYNTGEYIRRCVESIISQTYKDWELILIDDGSTDDSGEICDKYAQWDSRIKVVHKPNGGIASVRQLGIEMARGEYSIHIDSDDWIEPLMLEEMLDTAKRTRADIVITDYIKESKNGLNYYTQKGTDNTIDAIYEILTGKQIGSLWNKLIRHKLYNQYKLSFFPGINLGEDALMAVRMYMQQVSLHYLNKAYYHYMDNGNNTLSRGYTERKYKQAEVYYSKMLEIAPNQFSHIIKSRLRNNEIIALCNQLITVDELKEKGIKGDINDCFSKGMGLTYRIVALLYALQFYSLCKLAIKVICK